jgi:hypothetical protein
MGHCNKDKERADREKKAKEQRLRDESAGIVVKKQSEMTPEQIAAKKAKNHEAVMKVKKAKAAKKTRDKFKNLNYFNEFVAGLGSLKPKKSKFLVKSR